MAFWKSSEMSMACVGKRDVAQSEDWAIGYGSFQARGFVPGGAIVLKKGL
jgi:hypothetical protein